MKMVWSTSTEEFRPDCCAILFIRTSTTGDVMLIVSFFRNDKEDIEGLMAALAAEFPQITSLMYVVNEKRQRHDYGSGKFWFTQGKIIFWKKWKV